MNTELARPGSARRASTSACRIELSGNPIGMSMPTTCTSSSARTVSTSASIVGATTTRGRGAPGTRRAPTQPPGHPSTPSTGTVTSIGAIATADAVPGTAADAVGAGCVVRSPSSAPSTR